MDMDTPGLAEEIIQIIDRHPGLVANRFDNLRKIRHMIEHDFALRSLKEVLCFLDEKSLLDQNLFDFIIESKYNLNQLSIFLKWLQEFSVSSGEILDFFKQFDELNDVDSVITRLDELETRNVLNTEFGFTFFSALVDLINEGMDEAKYINLIKDSENTPTLIKALKILNRNYLLQDPYYEFVFDKDKFFPVIKAELISKLKNNDALDEKNFNLCKKETNLILRTELVKLLERSGISLRDNFLPLAAKNIHSLLGLLKYLEKNSLLTEEQITKIESASDNSLKYLINIILLVDELKLPDELSLLIIEKSERLRKLLKSIMVLKNENYLTVENYRLLSTNLHYPDVVFQFAQALVVLRNNQLDDVRWKDEAHNSENPLQFVFLLKEINKASLLSDANLAQMKRINVPSYFLRILRILNRLYSLTDETFAKLVKLDRVLVSAYPLYEKLSRMKNISLELLSDIFLISSEDLDRPTKLEKLEQLLELEAKSSLNRPRPSINREQSTHVSSVQFSISQSVKHFLQKYGESIIPSNLDKNFLEITNELKILASDDNIKNRAARNALEKIISASDYIEPFSKLSLKELLVLLWESIQDDSERISSLLDAKVQIIEGLYEIQRGGNIDAFGQDNGLPDEAICCTGAFNKLVEKMVGIHQFVEIINITPELAATKFPLVVREKVVDYLISLDPDQLLLTYDLLKEEGIAFIWEHIAAKVQEAMLEEFSLLYQLESGDVTEDFKRLMASHEDLEIDERLLANIKSSYAFRKLDLTTSVNAFSDCAEVSNVNQRLKRSVRRCIKKNTVKERRYRPFTALHREFEYALSFFMGRVESDLEKIVIEKIEILQKLIKDKYLSRHAFDNFSETSLEGICEIWLIAKRFLKEITDITESNLIEFSFGEKKYYITIKSGLHGVGSYRVYCSTINKEKFLEINSEVDVEETIETVKEILYPDVALYQIKTRYLRYFQPEGYLLISDFQAIFLSSVEMLKTEIHNFEGVPRKGFYDFFLINGRLPTESDVNFLFDYGLKLEHSKFSFALEKIPEVLSYFSGQEQIALGNFLRRYSIPVEETQSVLMGINLNTFHKDLLQLLIEYANKDEIISEEKLNELAYKTCYSELIEADLDSEEVTMLLEDLVQSHNKVKVKLEDLVGLSRLSILLAPALIKALNGDSDNLLNLVSMMGGDHLINESYLNLIKHEEFIRRLPKLSTLLQKGQYALASPIGKLLLLSSFYTLIKQLVNTPTNTPEHKMTQSLLVDNTVLFSVMFAEAFGLELGPAGIILDLGITIHQLLIAYDYIREHYHLQISLWEGVKFELGFDGIVREILESREMVHLNLVAINNLSKNNNYYFSHVVLKAPKIVELEAKQVERKEFPNFLLKKIFLSPSKKITSLRYLYKVETFMGRLQSYDTVSYLKRQILVASPQEISINFSEKNVSLVQENTVFVKFEARCTSHLNNYDFNMPCFQRFYDYKSGQNLCLKKICLNHLILSEGWSVASSTTLSDKQTGRIEKVHSVILDGDVGAMLKNERAFNFGEIQIKVLVLFNPHFGSMTIKDGSFLINQTLVVLIQDPPLADIIINDRIRSMSVFNFTGVDCLNTLHYWVGFNSLPCVVTDNLDYLSIYFMPLSLGDPEQTITMPSNSQLKIGEKGPKFIGMEQKRETIIYFNQGYFLYGYFAFISPIIKLSNPTVKPGAVAIFNLKTHQLYLLENVQGIYIFYSKDIEIQITIQVFRLGANTNINKQLNNAYIIESNQLLNFLIVKHDRFHSLTYNFTQLSISWCEIDCPLININTKIFNFLDLMFKGRFKLADKNCTAWFSFKAEKMGCHFFELNGADLLLANFASFKVLLDQGFTYFIFSKSGYLAEELKYSVSEKKIIYQEIQYRLDEDYQLVVVMGKLVTSHIESFKNLLPNIAIDLRSDDPPVRIGINTLQVADRIFTEIPTTALLLTTLGKQYMGLLPIFTPSEVRADNLQVNTQQINEKGYLMRSNKRSKDTSDSQLTSLGKGFIVLGSLLAFSILTKFIISYRHRVNNLPGMIEIGLVDAVATSLLTPAAQATHFNMQTSSIATNVASYCQYTQKNAKQPDVKQKATEHNRTNYQKVTPIFFERLPQQIIFLNWCIGFYRKLTHTKALFSENKFEQLFIILAKELTRLFHWRYITAQQKKVLHALLTSIHRLSFLIKPNTTRVLITKKTEFIIWNDFIYNLFVFERYFKHYFKQHRRSSLVCVLKRLHTISIEINHELLNCLDYLVAIKRLRKLLVLSANMPDVKQCYALNLPDPQWVIRRLNVLQDGLTDLKNSKKLGFSEFKYYLCEVLPEAKRLSSGLANKYFTLSSSGYLNLVAAMNGDFLDDNLFQGSNSSKAVNVPLATHRHLLKASFFILNKPAANRTQVDYAANDGNSVDFSARHSNLRNTSHSLG